MMSALTLPTGVDKDRTVGDASHPRGTRDDTADGPSGALQWSDSGISPLKRVLDRHQAVELALQGHFLLPVANPSKGTREGRRIDRCVDGLGCVRLGVRG